MTCVVCLDRPVVRGFALCIPCRRSLQRARDKDATVYAVLLWSANRSRFFERRRGKAEVRRVRECARNPRGVRLEVASAF